MGIGLSTSAFDYNQSFKNTEKTKSEKRKTPFQAMARSLNSTVDNLFGSDDRTTTEKIADSKKEIERLENKLEYLNNGKKNSFIRRVNVKRKLHSEKKELAKNNVLKSKEDFRSELILDGIKEILAENNDRRKTLGKISVLFDNNPPIDKDTYKPGFISSSRKEKNLEKNLQGSEYKLLKIQEILSSGVDEKTAFDKIEKIWYGDNSITTSRFYPFSRM